MWMLSLCPALKLPLKDNCGSEADHAAKNECIIPLAAMLWGGVLQDL